MDVERYYNNISHKLIEDYLYENPRTVEAIRYVLSLIPIQTKAILDLGCGIGWTSYEMARHLNATTIKGIDISPQLIRFGRMMFGRDNLELEKSAFENLEIENERYDYIVLIDVYEHVLPSHRKQIIRYFDKVLSQNGSIIITCPTKKHQQFLKAQHPDRIQPIDEIIEKSDLEEIALGIKGRLVDYKEIDIWNEQDYFHAFISRNRNFSPFSQKYRTEYPWVKYNNVRKTDIDMKVSKGKYILDRIKARILY